MGYLMGLFPPAQSDWARFSKVNVAMRACHVAMRDALRSTPATIDWHAAFDARVRGAAGRRGTGPIRFDTRWKTSTFARSATTISSACSATRARVRSGWTHRPPGGRTHRDGIPVLARVRGVHHPSTASMVNIPIIMTENGIGTDDDEQRIRYLTGALAGLSNVLADGIDVRGYSSGRCSTTSNGPSAIGPSSASSPSTARPSRGLPSHQRAGTPRRRESSPRPSSPSRIRHRPIERSR